MQTENMTDIIFRQIGNFTLFTDQRRWIRDSSVDVVTRILAEVASNRGLKHGSGKIIFFSGNSSHALRTIQPPACYAQRVIYVTGVED